LAPPEVQTRLAKVFIRDKVMGKFFSNREYSSKFLNPTILITDEEDKWTLLHEFMHYLFEKKRIELGLDDPNLIEVQSNVREDFLDLSSNLRSHPELSQKMLDQTVLGFAAFMNAEMRLAPLLTLEEITIEKTISKLFSQGEIKFLTVGQKQTADSYIEVNYKTISGQLDSYFAIRDQLQKYLGTTKSPSLDDTSRQLTWFRKELEKLIGQRSIASEGSIDSICGRFYSIDPAPEPSLQPKCQVQGDTLFWDGEVDGYLLTEIRDYHQNIKRIELNSYGGKLEDAFEIAEFIRSAQIATNVRKGARCASACTLIFQAGSKRTAHPLSRFLYHGPRIMEFGMDNWREFCQLKGRELCRENIAEHIFSTKKDTERLFAAYIRYDMSPKFLEEYKRLPIDPHWFERGNFTRTQDWILSAAQLVKYNIIQNFDLRETL
jgi:hypothetical protein